MRDTGMTPRGFVVVAGGLAMLAFGILLLSRGVRGWAVRSEAFRVSKVTVKGNRLLTETTLLSLAGLRKGVNIFTVDLGATARRLATDPRVERAAVGRRLPGELTILVKEREPVALLPGRSIRAVDRDGVVLCGFDPGTIPDLPFVTGLELGGLEVREKVADPRVHQALLLVEALRRADPLLAGMVSEIWVADPEGPLAYLGLNGTTVRFGTGNLHSKAKRLAMILAQLPSGPAGPAAIDLRFSGQAVVRPGL